MICTYNIMTVLIIESMATLLFDLSRLNQPRCLSLFATQMTPEALSTCKYLSDSTVIRDEWCTDFRAQTPSVKRKIIRSM